ncbi:MAG: NAD(P)/FAD-dependent oxidoreductase [Fibrobacterota bacterium]
MDIVICGGNFAGRAALRRLKSLKDSHRITLIDRVSHATMIPSLPDAAAGTVKDELIYADHGALLKGVQLQQDTIQRIDPARNRIIGSTREYAYDYCICATGSAALQLPVDMGDITVHQLISLNDALRIRSAFAEYCRINAAPHLVIIGGGYTGCELAGVFGGGDVPVTMVDMGEKIIPFLDEGERKKIEGELDRLGIDRRMKTAVDGADGKDLLLSSGERIAAPFVISAAGTVSSVEFPDEIGRERDGRIQVEPSLQMPGYANLFVCGDAAALRDPAGNLLRKAVNFSKMSGARAGDNCRRCVEGNALRSFRAVDPGWVIPVGKQSVGRLFGRVKISGKPGILLHYCMSGLQNFSLKNFFGFLGITLRRLFQ